MTMTHTNVLYKFFCTLIRPWSLKMFIYHGGIEQMKLWCVVRSICVVFGVKCLSSCVCFNILKLNHSFYDKLYRLALNQNTFPKCS